MKYVYIYIYIMLMRREVFRMSQKISIGTNILIQKTFLLSLIKESFFRLNLRVNMEEGYI